MTNAVPRTVYRFGHSVAAYDVDGVRIEALWGRYDLVRDKVLELADAETHFRAGPSVLALKDVTREEWGTP